MSYYLVSQWKGKVSVPFNADFCLIQDRKILSTSGVPGWMRLCMSWMMWLGEEESRGSKRGGGADWWEGERAGAPVPVVLSPPASCHQEIGNAADEDTPSGKRSNDDSSHNPSTHRQIGNGQLLRLFWGMREREREDHVMLWKASPPPSPLYQWESIEHWCVIPSSQLGAFSYISDLTIQLSGWFRRTEKSTCPRWNTLAPPTSTSLLLSDFLPTSAHPTPTSWHATPPSLHRPAFSCLSWWHLCPSRKRMRFWTVFCQGHKGLIGFSSSTCQIWDQALPDSSPLQQNLQPLISIWTSVLSQSFLVAKPGV